MEPTCRPIGPRHALAAAVANRVVKAARSCRVCSGGRAPSPVSDGRVIASASRRRRIPTGLRPHRPHRRLVLPPGDRAVVTAAGSGERPLTGSSSSSRWRACPCSSSRTWCRATRGWVESASRALALASPRLVAMTGGLGARSPSLPADRRRRRARRGADRDCPRDPRDGHRPAGHHRGGSAPDWIGPPRPGRRPADRAGLARLRRAWSAGSSADPATRQSGCRRSTR